MSKYCPLCNEYTNCTEDCRQCLAEETELETSEEENSVVETKRS